MITFHSKSTPRARDDPRERHARQRLHTQLAERALQGSLQRRFVARSTRRRVFGLMLSDVVKLVIPGVGGGLLLAAVLIRTMENVMGTPLTVGPTPLGVMEPLIYALVSTIAIAVALLAGFPAARRATAIQPMVAIRSE